MQIGEFTHVTVQLEFNIPGSIPDDETIRHRLTGCLENAIMDEFGSDADVIIEDQCPENGE